MLQIATTADRCVSIKAQRNKSISKEPGERSSEINSHDQNASSSVNTFGKINSAIGNFPRLIARYVREQKVLSLPEAIRKMTSWPATRMRISGRGLIKEGCWADVVVFDYDKIQDQATYEQPLLSPEGIEYVLVNGQVVIEKGRHNGARPGRVIYGPGRN